jgi:hypothetical protein
MQAVVPIGLSIALTDKLLTAIARDQTAQAQKHDLAMETAPPPIQPGVVNTVNTAV